MTVKWSYINIPKSFQLPYFLPGGPWLIHFHLHRSFLASTYVPTYLLAESEQCFPKDDIQVPHLSFQ